MRDFFRSELKTLHLKTGFQQYFKLSEMSDSAEQIKTLLDLLVAECDKFPMIPDADKKKIIQTCMIEDADFQGFNPKILWKWFNAACRRFIATQADYQEEDPASFVPCPPEERAAIDKMVQDYLKQLSGHTKDVFKGIEADMKAIQIEDKERQEGRKAVAIESRRQHVEQWEAENARRLEWRKENYKEDGFTKKPCWTEYEEWLELREAVSPPSTEKEQIKP